MQFTKLHGAGNDFIVVDGRANEADWTKLARAICDRHFGAGADGLLVAGESDVAALRMGLYNADGSEAEMSGNGMRCFVKYAVDHSLVKPDGGTIQVDTLAGVIEAGVTLADGKVDSVRVTMGRPRFEPREIPVAVEAEPPLQDVPIDVEGKIYASTCISMGNPHAVHFVDTPVADFPLAAVGPQVERHRLFPERVNFEVARVLANDSIEVRTWERGVGETLACGTGASAVMVAAHLRGLVGDRAEVRERGGTLIVEWAGGDSEVFLTGDAVEIYSGEWPEGGAHAGEGVSPAEETLT